MKTAGELPIEASHWREIARGMSDPDLLEAIQDLIAEPEARARETEDSA